MSSVGENYSTQNSKWAGGGVLVEGVIFAAPASANTVLRIDTSKSTGVQVSTFGKIEGHELYKFRVAVRAGQSIYFVPAEANKVFFNDSNLIYQFIIF